MVGETLNDRYRIERRLGGGSQAEVFLATDVHMERLVAIKIWKPEGGFTVDEFLREAKLLARFGAPHFVTIHEHAATLDQRPFFVLEYLQGETLQDLSTPLTAEEVCRCVRDVCVGLQKAHDEGVVHRDLKPSNLMLVDRGLRTERYVILDLGIAKITDTSNWRQTLADATMAGAGTLLYMSPEQCNGNPIDQRTDVYAFGCLLFMLLVHEEPFANKAGSHLSVLNAILSDPPRRLAEVQPDGVFSEGLEQLVQDCLAKKPEERPASMLEVEARFEACTPDNGLLLSTSAPGGRSGPGSSGIRTRRPIGSSTHPNRRPKRRLLTIGLLALVATAASGLAFFLTRPSSEATSSQKPVQTSLTQTPLTQLVESPKVNGTHASPEKAKDPLPNSPVKNSPVKQVSTRTAPSTSHPTEQVATRTESHTPVVSPVVTKPVIKPPPPPSTKDDRYFVVRNRALSANDPFGKDKDRNRYGVLANDGLPSGKSYEAECVEQPRFGQLHLNKDGTFTYTPRPEGDLAPADRFTYRVRAADNQQWSEPESVIIAIRPFSDEEDAVIKRIESDYGPASIRKEENPPTVIVDFAEQRVKKRIADKSLTILDGLGEVLRELQLDSQPITDTALDHLRHFSELRILSLAGTDVSAAGLPKLTGLKNLTDVDLSDTLLAESDVKALVTGGGRPAPLRVQRDGKIDRLRNLGIAIAGKNDLTLGRNAFVGTIPAVSLGDFQKISFALKDAPRLVGLVVSNPEIGDEWLTDSWVRQLKFLKSLDLRGTLVSPQQIALFRKVPGLEVQWDPPIDQLRSVGAVTQSGDGPVAIDLSGKKVDSRTWTLLSQVDKLATLNLSRVQIDGVGFQRLLQLTGLRALTLQETPLASKQVLEVCHAIPSLVELDVQKSPIAQENNVLRALQVELQSHDAKGRVYPEPAALSPGLLAAPFTAKDVVLARAAWAGYLNSPEQRVNSIGMKLQLIPPGEFRMGSEDTYLELIDRYPKVRETEEDNPVSRLGLESARPQHLVRITKPYYLGAYEVTNAQFNKFLDATGRRPIVPKNARPGWGFQPKKKADVPAKPNKLSKRYWGNSPDPKVPPVKPNAPPANPLPAQPANAQPSDQAPVVDVTWEDAVAFCEWLSVQKEEVKEKRVYRLPTEAEWEYACRAGSTTRFWKDDDPEHLTQIGNVRDLAYKEKYGKDNTLNSSDGAADPCDVGQYPANQFDLFDMHGNVAEWCSDWFSRSYYRQTPQANPTGPSTGALRVVRGGSWHSSAIFTRSANRAAEPPTHHFDRIGFRVVCFERRAPWPPVVSIPAPPAAGPAPQLLVAPFDVNQIAEARKVWAGYSHVDEKDDRNPAGLSMILIPPGEFMMGSSPEQIAQAAKQDPTFKKESGDHEQPQHRVRITRPFYLSAHEVTREQFTRFVKATGYRTVCERPNARPGVVFDPATGKYKSDKKVNWRNPGFAQDDNHPVVYISWRDALAFCTWLTWQEGKTYRLPTEAEWEYACRAGTTTLYSNGDDAESLVTVANVMDATAKETFLKQHALKARDGFVFTAPVGSFQANAFGIFDMHGNAREWCSDWSADEYYGRSPEIDPPGPVSGTTHVIRGGAWTYQPAACRSASRGAASATNFALNLGFRVAADVPAK